MGMSDQLQIAMNAAEHWQARALAAESRATALATENQAMRAERDDLVEQLTVWKAAWAQLARNQVGPIAAAYDQEEGSP
jgi:hypothetical protein